MAYTLIVSVTTLTLSSAILEKSSNINLTGVLFFGFIGLFAPSLVRYLTYIGVDKVGPSRSEQIRSLTPLFAILFAIIFLDEKLTIGVIVSISLILSGIMTLIKNKEQKNWHARDLIFPFMAAVLAGAAANLRKFGFELLPSPLIAASATSISALIAFPLYMKIQGKTDKINLAVATWPLLIIAGLLNSISILLNLYALKLGNVTTVVTILASTPLFVILVSAIFLKKVEMITKNLIISAVLIFTGIQILIFYGN